MILITSVFPFILCVGGWLGFPFSEQVIPAPFSLSFLILFIFYFLNFNIILAHAILPDPNEKESESKVVVFVFHRRPAKTDWAGGCYLLHFWFLFFVFFLRNFCAFVFVLLLATYGEGSLDSAGFPRKDRREQLAYRLSEMSDFLVLHRKNNAGNVPLVDTNEFKSLTF